MDAEKKDLNPFSFKTFMKRGEGPPAAPGPPGSSGGAGAGGKKGAKKKGAGKKAQNGTSIFDEGEDIGIPN